MKHHFTLVLLLAFASYTFAQTLSAPRTQSAPEEKPKLRDFGSSLKEFGKNQKNKSRSEKGLSAADDEDIIRIKTDLVVNDVLVVTQKGNLVSGLERSDFVITEDGVPQKVSTFSFGENSIIPRSIVLIIDYSGSLFPFIKNSVEAAKILVDKLDPQDRMAIVTDDVKLLVDFTNDKAALKKELDQFGETATTTSGRSEQYSALVATLNEMFDEEDIRPIIVFQTDGDELMALKGEYEYRFPFVKGRVMDIPVKNYSFADVRSLVNRSRATIYTIVPGFRLMGLSQREQLAMTKRMGDEVSKSLYERLGRERPKHLPPLPPGTLEYTAQSFEKMQLGLFDISRLSGGYIDFLERPEDAENVYSNIFKVINNRYVIGYYPTNKERNGKRRNVKIEVHNHPEYIVTGRKAYLLQ